MKPSIVSAFSRRAFLRRFLAIAAVVAMVPQILGQSLSALPPNGSFRVRTPDGLALAAQAQGDPGAPEILLIHGLGQSRLIWSRQLSDPVLASFRIVCFDLRGHGDSDKPASETAYADGKKWADDVAAVIATARLHRPVLVGWSLGGPVLLHYLESYGRKQVAGINFVDAVTHLGPDLLRPATKDFARRLSSEDFAVRTAAIVDFLKACFATPPPQGDLDRMLVFNGMVPRAVQLGVAKIPDGGYDKVIARFQGPILVTFGAKDLHLFPKMAYRVVALNHGAKLSIYPKDGHSPFYESPKRFDRELAAFARLATDATGSVP